MMNLTVFGASRGVGRRAVDLALARGHSVTAVARGTDALDETSAQLIAGDVLEKANARRALEHADAVLVALGTSPRERSGVQSEICSRATRSILDVMAATGPRRIVVVSSYGVGPTRAKRPFPFNLIAATLLRGVMNDKEEQERLVRASATEWTIAQPLGLTDDAPSGSPYVSTDGTRELTRVSRDDVAAVCIDAIESRRYLRESIAISGRRTVP